MSEYQRKWYIRAANRYSRQINQIRGDVIPSLLTVTLLSVMIVMTLFTIGESPSGPAADLPLSQRHDGSSKSPLIDHSSTSALASIPERKQAGRIEAIFLAEKSMEVR